MAPDAGGCASVQTVSFYESEESLAGDAEHGRSVRSYASAGAKCSGDQFALGAFESGDFARLWDRCYYSEMAR